MVMNVRKNLFKCAGMRLNVQTLLILGNDSDVLHGVALVNVESAVDENIDDDSQLWSGLNIIVNLEKSVQTSGHYLSIINLSLNNIIYNIP